MRIITEHLSEHVARRKFFQRVEWYYTRRSLEYQLVEKAYAHVEGLFRGVYRDDGSPYMSHLRAVPLALMRNTQKRDVDHHDIIAAIHHDSMEDAELSEEGLRAEYGFIVARLVKGVSKPTLDGFISKKARNEAYHDSFAKKPFRIVRLKLCDRDHNLSSLAYCSREKQERIMSDSWKYYLGYARQHDFLYHEILTRLEYHATMHAVY